MNADLPLVALKGFQRINLKKGEQKTVTFNLTAEDFSVTNGDAVQVVVPGTFEIAVGGGVPGKNAVIKTINLTGEPQKIE